MIFVLVFLVVVALSMAVTIPDWFIPSKGHLTNVTLTPQVNTNGTLSDGTSVVLTGRLSRINVDLSPEKSEINAITSPRHNNVVLGDGWHIDIAVLKANGSATNNGPLRDACLASDIFKLSWVEGTIAGKIQTITAYGSRGTYNSDIGGRGEVMESLGFDSVDTGAADFFKVVVS